MSIQEFREASKNCGSKFASVWEIKLEQCTKQYAGEGCGADENDLPCRNTFKTCKSKCDFECRNKSFFHSDCDDNCLLDIAPEGYVPDVVSFSTNGSKFEICQGMPGVETQVLKLQDSKGSDYFEDPYRDRRPHNAKDKGTRLEKWIQANNMEGRLVTWHYGPCDGSYPDSWLKRDYFIDSINGPTGRDRQYTLKLKDPFSLITEDKRTVPPTTNNLKLNATINRASNTIDVPFLLQEYQNTFFDTAIADIPDDFYVCIDDKIMRVRPEELSNNNERKSIFRIIEKGVCDTDVLGFDEEIKKDTPVTLAKHWPKGTNIVQIIFDIIFQDGVNIPSTQLFRSDVLFKGEGEDTCDCGPVLGNIFDEECFTDLARTCASFYFTDEVIICEPTSIKDLLNEIAQTYLIAPYIDDFTGLVKLKQIVPPKCDEIASFPVIDECSILLGSESINRDRNRVATEVSLFTNPPNCLADRNDYQFTNAALSSANLVVDENSSFQGVATCNNPAWRLPKRKSIFTRFLRGCNLYQRDLISRRTLELRQNIPIEFTFTVSGKDLTFVKGDYIIINHPLLQDIDGCETKDIFYVKSLGPTNSKANLWKVVAESSGFNQCDVWVTSTTCDDLSDCGTLNIDITDDQAPTFREVEEFFRQLREENCVVDNLAAQSETATSVDVNFDPDNPELDTQSNQVARMYQELANCQTINCKKMW